MAVYSRNKHWRLEKLSRRQSTAMHDRQAAVLMQHPHKK